MVGPDGKATAGGRTPVRVASRVLAVLGLELTAVGIVSTVVPLRTGLVAFIGCVELQLLLLAAVVLAVATAVARTRLAAMALVAVLAFTSVRFGPELLSVPRADDADLTVLTWNVEAGSRTGPETVEALRRVTADVIAIQELQPDVAAFLDDGSDLAARYPYRYLEAKVDTSGLGLLSRYPLVGARGSLDPAVLEAIVHTPRGDVTIFDCHPLPYLVEPSRSILPATYDARVRDAQLAAIRARIDAALTRGERVLAVGDFNTSPTEPGYATLAAGLHDAHAETGQGPGWTWRPPHLEFLPPVVRLDLQLSGGPLVPVDTSIDCSAGGDHCRVFAGYRLGATD